MGHSNNGVLTGREAEVLKWMCRGKSNWEIGHILGLSEYTIKNHVSRILKKLDVVNRQHAVARAFQSGLIALDAPRFSIRSSRLL